MADVFLRVHQDEIPGGRRAQGRPAASAVPRSHRLIGARDHGRQVDVLAPGLFELVRDRDALVPRRCPRIVVVGFGALRVGAVEDQCAGPLRICRAEEDGHRAALRVAEQRSPCAADGIHDCTDVIHAGLEIGQADGAIGQPGPALIEANQASKGAEPFEEAGMVRMLPVHLEMREEPRYEHKVERPTTRDLVGDVDLTAAGVTDRGSHASIVPHRRALAGGRSNRRMVGRLGGHRTRQQMERLVAGSRRVDSAHVFSTTIGTPIEPGAVSRAFHAALDHAKPSPNRFHDLRHAAATFALSQGFTLEDVEEPPWALVDRPDVEHLRACARAAAAAGGESDGRRAERVRTRSAPQTISWRSPPHEPSVAADESRPQTP